MIAATLFSVSLGVQASLSGVSPPRFDPQEQAQIVQRQRDAALLPAVHRATACIVRRVKADTRYHDALRPGDINDLIVDAIPACEQPVRILIDVHDRMFGNGSGEAFFMGPYLDVLPAAVARQVQPMPVSQSKK